MIIIRHLLFVLSLLLCACRSGHFENRSLAHSYFDMNVSLYSSAFVNPCERDALTANPKCYVIEMTLSLETLENEFIQDHPIIINLEHPNLRSPAKQDLITDEHGQVRLQMEFDVNPLDLTALYEVGLEITSSYFGTKHFVAIVQVLKPKYPVLSIRADRPETFEPSITSAPKTLFIEPINVVRIGQKKRDHKTEDIQLRATFKLFDKNSLIPFSNKDVFISIDNKHHEFQSDEEGKVSIFFDMPYFPFDHQKLHPIIMFFRIDPLSPKYLTLYLDFEDGETNPLVDYQQAEEEHFSTPKINPESQLVRLPYYQIHFEPEATPPYEVQLSMDLSRNTFDGTKFTPLDNVLIRGKGFILHPNTYQVFHEEIFEIKAENDGTVLIPLRPAWTELSSNGLDPVFILVFELPEFQQAARAHFKLYLNGSRGVPFSKELAVKILGGALLDLTKPYF